MRIVALVALGLVACHRPPASPTARLSAAEAQTAARALREQGLTSVGAKFTLRLVTPKSNITAAGALVARAPDHFRVEVSGPIGPPALVIAADGKAVNALETGKSLFHAAPDAESALRALTGGAAGLDVVTALILGQYVEPASGLVGEPVAVGESYVWTWCTSDGACLAEGLSMATGRLVSVQARGRDGLPLLDATLTPGSDTPWPAELVVDMPALHVQATATFHSWNPASPPDPAFVLAPPPGATVKPIGP